MFSETVIVAVEAVTVLAILFYFNLKNLYTVKQIAKDIEIIVSISLHSVIVKEVAPIFATTT
tara:strand:- start:419 stop:604 length:186 start_codon:yes stop_codon:yes gene_type:complete